LVEGDPLFDFLVLNATISSSQYTVRTSLTGPGVRPGGIQRLIKDWKPWLMLNAREGAEYKIEVELLDPVGEAVTYGTATRTFSMKQP
jgi:hypothetical protein